jgi:hypothetical protein
MAGYPVADAGGRIRRRSMAVAIGPDHLSPGKAPGGVVLRVYKPDGKLLVERALVNVDLNQASAKIDAAETLEAFIPGEPVEICIVCYDGDTGVRWPADDWVWILTAP